jgi:hypothetical protein
LAIIILLTIIISMLISGVDLALSCDGYCSVYSIKKPLYLSIIFAESSIFFIIITAVVWLVTTLSKTNQFIIISIYSNKKTTMLKSLLLSAAIISIAYVFLFNSLASHHIKNYISSTGEDGSGNIDRVWISTLKTANDSASGSVYFMKNARKYLDGYLLDSMSIYKVNGGYFVSYKKISKPFLTPDTNNNITIALTDINGNTSKTIESGISIEDIDVEFKMELHQGNIGFSKSVLTLFKDCGVNYRDKVQSQITIIKTFEVVLMIFLAITLSICEFPPYNQRFDSRVRGRILRVLIFSILCYTSVEVLKIIGGGDVGSYLVSLACCVALIFIFLSRLIKHHH